MDRGESATPAAEVSCAATGAAMKDEARLQPINSAQRIVIVPSVLSPCFNDRAIDPGEYTKLILCQQRFNAMFFS